MTSVDIVPATRRAIAAAEILLGGKAAGGIVFNGVLRKRGLVARETTSGRP